MVAGYNGAEKLVNELLKKVLNLAAGELNTCTDLLFPIPVGQELEIKTGFTDCACEFEIEEFCDE